MSARRGQDLAGKTAEATELIRRVVDTVRGDVDAAGTAHLARGHPDGSGSPVDRRRGLTPDPSGDQDKSWPTFIVRDAFGAPCCDAVLTFAMQDASVKNNGNGSTNPTGGGGFGHHDGR